MPAVNDDCNRTVTRPDLASGTNATLRLGAFDRACFSACVVRVASGVPAWFRIG